jgi:hypothetical protein
MFTDDPPELEDIEKRLRAAVRMNGKPDDDNVEAVLAAHMNMLVWYLALVCSGCRARLWKQMKRMFPQIIRHAIELSSTVPPDHPARGQHIH